MEKVLVFTHRLDLALRLVDTTTGTNISGRTARIRADGDPVPFAEKPDGILIMQNLGREQFQLEVSVPGFEPVSCPVDRGALDKALPLLELQMIPGKGYPAWIPLLTADGKFPGIRELTAVKEGSNAILARELDPRRRQLTIFNPHHLSMDRVHYAVVDPDKGRYEPFRILKMVNDNTLKIDRVLEMEFKNYFPICPLVFGRVGEEGDWRLCVRDDSTEAKWLLRCTVNGQPHYKQVDFRQESPPDWGVR